MLTFYHYPMSPNSRRVWIALLEKELPFEEVVLKLNGDQLQPEFLEISPFHHIPALVDDGFSLVESQAILDYLEAKYPTPSLRPTEPKALGIVQMVRMATINELAPAMSPMVSQMMGMRTPEPEKLEESKQKLAVVLKFFEGLLEGKSYFGGDSLSLADITAGVSIPWLPQLGMPLDDYPQVIAWRDRVQSRPSWETTKPTPEMIAQLKALMQARMAKAKN
ncbi:glutathione S-transferase family protein [Lusitaniella coriacea]|uniref:glutathione S-transferase family protein n=1 Tax=Lusitaniella coriacea TaxID=1983105 RepID=UPI003CF6B440